MSENRQINLRADRLNRGLSLEDAAEAIDVPKNVLQSAETRASTPRPESAFKIAEFYGYKVTDIWPVEEFTGKAAA